MKKVLLLTIAALSMLFTQCKKTDLTPQPTPTTGEIHISVSVDGGAKLNVNPGEGTVAFSNGDVMYVASDGKYVGTLTCDGSKFSGTITGATENAHLYFYFLGNKGTTENLKEGETTIISADISNQSTGLPVISAGQSDKVFTTSNKSYKTTLYNKCGLVKFTAAGYTGGGNITIKKMNNKVTVDLSKNLGDGAFTNEKVDEKGPITLNKVTTTENDVTTTAYWAILLPRDEEVTGDNGDAYTSDNWSGTYDKVPAITNNSYVTGDAAVKITLTKNASKQ